MDPAASCGRCCPVWPDCERTRAMHGPVTPEPGKIAAVAIDPKDARDAIAHTDRVRVARVGADEDAPVVCPFEPVWARVRDRRISRAPSACRPVPVATTTTRQVSFRLDVRELACRRRTGPGYEYDRDSRTVPRPGCGDGRLRCRPLRLYWTDKTILQRATDRAHGTPPNPAVPGQCTPGSDRTYFAAEFMALTDGLADEPRRCERSASGA